MKVVVDTNVLLSGIFWKGLPGKIVQLWFEERVSLVVCAEILREYEVVLERIRNRKGLEEDILKSWKAILFQKCLMVEPGEWENPCRDPDDQKFLNIAFVPEITCLITGDDDLLAMKDWFPNPIVTPREFFEHIFLPAKPKGKR